MYAGWWGGNPAELIPARRSVVARDVVEAAGRDVLVERVRAHLADGEPRRALHLVMHLVEADHADRDAQTLCT
jgi:alkyl sulfatase BDS1-like metallo-beta-lactamase superfamily hydrolase